MPRTQSLEPKIVRFPKDEQNWYVLVVAYRTEQKMQAKLRELGKLEAFVPMRRTRRRDAQGKFRYDERWQSIITFSFTLLTIASSVLKGNFLLTWNTVCYTEMYIKKVRKLVVLLWLCLAIKC